MLRVNNNCTDILEKMFLETCFQVVRYKGSGINVKKKLPCLSSGHYFFATDFARKSNYIISCEMRKVIQLIL